MVSKLKNLRQGNSLTISWQKEFPNIDYIIGNPPFIGKHLQNDAQKSDIDSIRSSLADMYDPSVCRAICGQHTTF